MEKASFAARCLWGMEAAFQQVAFHTPAQETAARAAKERLAPAESRPSG